MPESVAGPEVLEKENNMTMRKAGKPIVVQLPSNKKFQIPADKEDTVRDVFKAVIKRLAIEDSSLLGLMYSPVKGVWEFVSPDHKLKVYAPDKWKSDTPSSPAVNLRLAVKYYPPGPHKFINPISRLQFFLNIRNLILDGTYQISKEAAFDLAALSLQADLGNFYDKNVAGNQYFEPHNYVPPEVMSAVSYQYVSKEIPMLHSKLDDMSQNEAVIRYLQIASQLPDYGIHFFEVKEPVNYETEHTCIGISLKAILLYEKSEDVSMMRGSPMRIPWNKIMNLSYKNKTFILDVSFVKKNKTQRRYNFVTESTKVSRIVMTLCADTHKFYLKLKNMLPTEEQLEPTFSVRDYTPSPRSVITNNSPDLAPNGEYASGEGNPKSKVTSQTDNSRTTTEFDFLYNISDLNLDRQQDIKYNSLNLFTARSSRVAIFDYFKNAEPIAAESEHSDDSVDIPADPEPVYLKGDIQVLRNATQHQEAPAKPHKPVTSHSPSPTLSHEDTVVEKTEYVNSGPLSADVSNPEEIVQDPVADKKEITPIMEVSEDSPATLPSLPRPTEDTFAYSFKVKKNSYKNYKETKAAQKDKKKLKKAGSFFNLRRSKSTTDVVPASPEEPKTNIFQLKRSQSGVLETTKDPEDEPTPGVSGILKKDRKEEKKRKRLRLLSRGQRLKKKTSSKVSFDDYVTESEYESDEDGMDRDWIESPGYNPHGLSLDMFPDDTTPPSSPEGEEELEIPVAVEDIAPPRFIINSIRSFSSTGNLDEMSPTRVPAEQFTAVNGEQSVPKREHFEARDVIMTRVPDLLDNSTSSGGSLTTSRNTLMDQVHSIKYSITYDNTADLPNPVLPEKEYDAPPQAEVKEEEVVVPLVMEAERGKSHIDMFNEVFAVDMGIQTSVNTVSIGFGNDSIHAYATFGNITSGKGSVSKGNKKSYKKVKKRYF